MAKINIGGLGIIVDTDTACFYKSTATGQCYYDDLPMFGGYVVITKDEYNAYYKASGMPEYCVD